MKALKHVQRGLTLIELVIFIVIILVGLAGVLTVLDTTVRGSADPVVRKQALALAEAMLEEVLAKEFQNDPTGNNAATPALGCTPTTAPRCALNTPIDRVNYNDVDDYNTWSQPGNVSAIGAAPAALARYQVNVAVAAWVLNGETGKRVTVSVVSGTETVTLEGFRGNL
jgi:MSHA pilin protein MshD